MNSNLDALYTAQAICDIAWAAYDRFDDGPHEDMTYDVWEAQLQRRRAVVDWADASYKEAKAIYEREVTPGAEVVDYGAEAALARAEEVYNKADVVYHEAIIALTSASNACDTRGSDNPVVAEAYRKALATWSKSEIGWVKAKVDYEAAKAACNREKR